MTASSIAVDPLGATPAPRLDVFPNLKYGDSTLHDRGLTVLQVALTTIFAKRLLRLPPLRRRWQPEGAFG